MADNIDVTPGTGKTVAADEIAGALHQRVKITVGADGTNDGDVSSANPLPVNDAGGSLTVDNAHLTSLGGAVSGTEVQVDIVASLPEGTNAIGKLSENSGVDIGDVDVTSCALPTGASTAAKQDTIIGHVDGIETVLGTIDGDTSDLAGCVAGTEVQVDVVAPLPAGTNAIGKLAANSGVDIGDVDVTSTVLPTVTSIGNGAKDVTTAGSPVALAGSTACKKVFISSKDTNTGKIFIGGSGVSASSGCFIYPGGSITLEISNLSSVYIDSAVNGEGVQFTYLA